MTDERLSGIALIVGSIASIITMSFHPTGQQVIESGPESASVRAAVAVHALAMFSLPILFMGAAGLSKYLQRGGRMVVAALTIYGFGSIAAMNAAVVSGLVAPGLAHRLAIGSDAANDLRRTLFRYTADLNRGFALVFVIASSIAILLWSLSMLKVNIGLRRVSIYGCFIGPVVIIAVLSGHIRMNVHGFGAIVLSQTIWQVVVGTHLTRKPHS
jgi:hypothetical protein